jgi:hypothetical protein
MGIFAVLFGPEATGASPPLVLAVSLFPCGAVHAAAPNKIQAIAKSDAFIRFEYGSMDKADAGAIPPGNVKSNLRAFLDACTANSPPNLPDTHGTAG